MVGVGYLLDSLQNSDLKTANGKDRLRILHVNDDPCILEASKSILEMKGNFEVDTALSVDEAFRKMEQQTYDAVISDYEMPQKNGLNFLAELRGKRNKIPFILFTGKGREEVAIKALNLGANYYLNKAGSPETMYGELAHAIETAVRSVRVESALKASEERFRAVFEGASDGILGADPETKRLVLANPTMCKLTGYSLDELTKLGVGDIHPKKDLPHVLDEFEKQLKDEIALALDIPVLKKDGQVVYCDVNSRLVTIENRKVMAGFFRDTTERKRTEENLRKSEEKYRGLFESTQDGIIISDAQGVVASANQAAAAMLGYKNAEELANAPAETLYADPEDRRVLFELLAKKGTVKDYEVKLKRKNGETFDVRMTVALQRDLQGNVLRSEAILRDITERKRMREELQESEGRLKSVVENSSDQIFMVDRDCRFLLMNNTAADLFGLSPQEVVGRSIFEIFPETIAAQFSKNIENVFDTGKRMLIDEKMVVKGRELYSSSSLNPVRNDRGRVMAVTGIVRDITERKKAEEEKNRLIHNLGERVKELRCIYDVSKLFEKNDTPLDSSLQETVDLLPPAMQYPDITCARIVVENQEFSTKNFKDTQWKLQADLKVLGKKAGFVESVTLKRSLQLLKAPFLKKKETY